MKADELYDALAKQGLDMYCGVPDSLLKEFCACVSARSLTGRNIIAANEGNALALAAGHYLATGHPAVVYMQNSGLGNVVNPLLSLTDEEVYRIPALLLIGWRGEPGVHDEPQHVKQGKLTLPLLETMGIPYEILSDLSQVEDVCRAMMTSGKPHALVVRKGLFEAYSRAALPHREGMVREEAIRLVTTLMGERDLVVSTTGMISRELYESRETHERDFLTVGSMGHASSIALGIALAKPERKVFVFDGDGAFLMHMGAAAVVASCRAGNLKHIVFNNEAHDSVGAQPTVMGGVDLPRLAQALGYAKDFCARTPEELRQAWDEFYGSEAPCLLEIKVTCGSRKDLGRPKEKPWENKERFEQFIQE